MTAYHCAPVAASLPERGGDQAPFDVRFDLLHQEAAQIGRGGLRPVGRGEVARPACAASRRRWPAIRRSVPRLLADAERARGNRRRTGPARPRLKNARSGSSGSSSTLPQPRQTCSSGSHPDKPHRPQRKIRHRPPDAAAGSAAAQMLQHGQQQAEKLLARLGGGQQLLRNFREDNPAPRRPSNRKPSRTASGSVRRNPG